METLPSQAEVTAAWTLEESDLVAAGRAYPGSTLSLLRWPVGFLLAWVGIGLANAHNKPNQPSPAFVAVSGLVIVAIWLLAALGSRGSQRRRIAKLPEKKRAVRVSIDGVRFRQENAEGEALEVPIARLTHAKLCAAGILLKVDNQIFFVPNRAVKDEAAWRALVAKLPQNFPSGLAVTAAVWLGAVGIAVYALFGK